MKTATLLLVLFTCGMPAVARKYKYLDYQQIADELHELAKVYPNYVKVESAQSKYGLPHYGTCGKGGPCTIWMATVTHFASLRALSEKEGTATSSTKETHSSNPVEAKANFEYDTRPTVFFSGALHGNERIGPTTTLEGVKLLATVASCVDASLEKGRLKQDGNGLCPDLSPSDEAMLAAGTAMVPSTSPHGSEKGRRSSLATTTTTETETATLLAWRKATRRRRLLWLHRLARTRRVIVMPAANAVGYYANKREEGRIDPNRDFPFVQSASHCMQTVAARALNEVWRSYLLPAAISFHGGLQAIAYEWGSPIHPKAGHRDLSPDDQSQAAVSRALAIYGGKGAYSRHKLYPTSPMNTLVYPVNGGMEDWAYAASWDFHDPTDKKQHARGTVPGCIVGPNSNGYEKGKFPYPPEKTTYTASMLRTANLLVETSDDKTPHQDTLGAPAGLFLPRASSSNNDATLLSSSGSGNGHISRNLRLLLATADLVEPYVEWAFDAMEMAEFAANDEGAAEGEHGDEEKDHQQQQQQQQPSRYWEASSVGSAGSGGAKGGHGSWLWTGTVTVADDLGGKTSNAASTTAAVSTDLSRVESDNAPGRVAWRIGGALLVDHTELVVGCWPRDDDDDESNIVSGRHDHQHEGSDAQSGLRGKRNDHKSGRSSSNRDSWAALLSEDEEEEGAPTPSQSSSTPIHAHTIVVPASRGSGNARWVSPSTLLAGAPPPASGTSGDVSNDKDGGSGDDGHVFWAFLPSASELLKLNCSPHSNNNGDGEGGEEVARYFAAARAVVDANWGIAPKGAQPEGELGAQPQGHLAQARTNPAWRHVVNGQELQGRTKWHAPPLELKLPQDSSSSSSLSSSSSSRRRGKRRGGGASVESDALTAGATTSIKAESSSSSKARPVSLEDPSPNSPSSFSLWGLLEAWLVDLGSSWGLQTWLLLVAALCCFKWCFTMVAVGIAKGNSREGRRRYQYRASGEGPSRL